MNGPSTKDGHFVMPEEEFAQLLDLAAERGASPPCDRDELVDRLRDGHFATRRGDRKAALKFLKRAMKRYGRPKVVVTDRLGSYQAAMKVTGNTQSQECVLTPMQN